MVAMIDIAGRTVGSGEPCFIIAEAGINHNGSIETARQLIDVAAKAGADAIKFQTFTAANLATLSAPKADYQLQTTKAAESQHEMLRRLELAPEAHEEIREHCREAGILFMSTPFDQASADFLADLGVEVFKISSGEITNLPFLAHVARKGKTTIVSTGMSSLGEVETAVNTINQEGLKDVILLHCVSNYPADPADVNLRAMLTMSVAFGLPVGYSDHTLGIDVALAAVAMGAHVLEKHFTLDRNLEGPDHLASIEPDELAALIRSIRTIEQAMGTGRKAPVASEYNTAATARRSLVAAQDIPLGTVLSEEMITLKRPGTGLAPALLPYIVDRKTQKNIPAGTLLDLEMLA